VEDLSTKKSSKVVLRYQQIDGVYVLVRINDFNIEEIRVNKGIPDSAFDE
jgi:hypothetical protein